MAKPKRRAVRNFITGKVDHYTHTKTVGIRNPITGEIVRREKKKSGFFF
jgi:hypothetical protein